MRYTLLVKTHSSESKVISFDVERREYIISIHAKPVEGEANKELIHFFKKELKKDIRIVSGFRSKKKIIEVLS